MRPRTRTDCFGLEPTLASFLMQIAAALAIAVNVGAAPALQYESTLQLPSESLRASRPVSVARGADGSLCVTDATSRTGFLFDPQNIVLFSTGPIAGLSDPLDLVVEASGGFVCTDGRPEGGRTVRRLDFYGFPLAYEPERPLDFWQPERLLIARDGHYITTDPANGLLAKHDAATGALLWKRSLQDLHSGDVLALGKPAEGPDGRLYLPVPGDRQVMVLSTDGQLETSFGTPGGARGRLAFPIGVAFCPDGSIAVLDKMRHVILLYDEQHSFVSEFGEFGMDPSDLYYPAAIASTGDGRVVVVQGFEGRIHVFRFSATGAANVTASRSRLKDAGRVERSNRSQREGGAKSGVLQLLMGCVAESSRGFAFQVSHQIQAETEEVS